MATVSYIAYTHSEYSIIWDVVIEQVVSLYKPHMTLYVFIDRGADSSKFITAGFTVIEYDPSLTYPQKMASCLEHIPTEYIIFVHDNQLPCAYNDSTIQNAVSYMKINNIHRIDAYIYDGHAINNRNLSLPIQDNFSISRNNGFYPYNVGPGIWNTKCITEIMKQFNHMSYREIDTSPVVHQFAMNKYNIFVPTPHKHTCVKSVVDRWCNITLAFKHIIGQGKFLVCNLYNCDYGDHVISLYDKYNLAYKSWSVMLNRT